MSLIKLFKAPIKLFKKDIITFVVVKRHDLRTFDDKLRYIAVKSWSSMSEIRQKVWYLLDLPDYCEEIIVLKNQANHELPFTELRKGNDPQHPYILEVWLPDKSVLSTKTLHTMITMGETKCVLGNMTSALTQENDTRYCNKKLENGLVPSHTTLNKSAALEDLTDYKHSNLSCKISTSTIFFKLHGKKSRDNFANLLLKIQSDLAILTTKLSNLENRIQL